jgi:outer membrane receptor protein involved in Fe transport
MNNFTTTAIALGVAMAAGSLPAFAQTEEGSGYMLEEIIVTAQKREESLQDVPVAVDVVSGQALIDNNILDFEQMADTLPSLGIVNVANITAISIRGLGTTDNGGFEQSVGFFIDGVHQPKDRLYRATSFLDVANVQVLKGPQGTLFGKNTTAGALMLTSNRPSQEFEAGVTGTYTFDHGDQNGGYTGEAFVSGGLTDTLSARVALRYIKDENYFTNVLDSGDLDAGDTDSTAGRVSLLWEPSDTFSALLKAEAGRSRVDGEPNRTLNYVTATSPGLGITPGQLIGIAGTSPLVEGPYVQSWNPGFDDTDTHAVTLTLDWQLGEYQLLSITSYTDFDYEQNRDADWTSADLLNQDDQQEYDAFSQEFRVVSPLGGELFSVPVDYVAGVYYQSSSDDSTETRNYNVSLIGLPDATTDRRFTSDNETFSIYGNFDIQLASAWTLSLGGNYNWEEKDAKRTLSVGGPAFVPELIVGDIAHEIEGDRSVGKFNKSVKLRWDVADDYMLYASWAEAFKSGGFDETGNQGDDPGEFAASAGPAQFEFDDEKVNSYEIGGKGLFLDGRLNANWAAFYVEVTDRQFSRFVPGEGFVVGNSGETTYRGVEFESQYLITENLLWDVTVAFLQGDIKEPIDTGSLQLEEKGRDKSIPKWGGTNHIGYTLPLGNLELKADMYNIYDDSVEFTGINLGRDSSWRTNLRLGVGSSDGVWEVALLADNITDEEVFITAQVNAIFTDSAVGPGTAGEAWVRMPRTFTAQFKYNF